MWQGEAMYGLIRPCALYVRLLIFGALLIWMWLMYNFSTSKLLKSALASALLSRWSKCSADFAGQRPWVHLWALHWALRPTPPLKRLNGTISFFAITFFKNCWALLSVIPEIALAVSRVFWVCNHVMFVSLAFSMRETYLISASFQYLTLKWTRTLVPRAWQAVEIGSG